MNDLFVCEDNKLLIHRTPSSSEQLQEKINLLFEVLPLYEPYHTLEIHCFHMEGSFATKLAEYFRDRPIELLILKGDNPRNIKEISKALGSLQVKHLEFHAEFGGDTLFVEALSYFSQNEDLESLDVSECQITDDGGHKLTEFILSHKNVKRLILDGNRFGTKTAEGLGECVASHPNLQILSMRWNISDIKGSIAHIFSALQSPNCVLTELYLDECTILPSFVHELEALVRNQSLKVLSLNSCFGGCESDHIVKCIRMIAFYIGANQYLEKLYFSNNSLGNPTHQILYDGISKSRSIKSLDISENAVGNLAAFLEGDPSLEYLRARSNTPIVLDGDLLRAIANNKTLRHFDTIISFSCATLGEIKEFFHVIPNYWTSLPTLEICNLGGCMVEVVDFLSQRHFTLVDLILIGDRTILDFIASIPRNIDHFSITSKRLRSPQLLAEAFLKADTSPIKKLTLQEANLCLEELIDLCKSFPPSLVSFEIIEPIPIYYDDRNLLTRVLMENYSLTECKIEVKGEPQLILEQVLARNRRFSSEGRFRKTKAITVD